MQMVAASKMNRAKKRMELAKPYANRAREIIGHLAKSKTNYANTYLKERAVKRVGYIVVSTDRGLCGGLNVNLFKKTVEEMEAWDNKKVKIDVAIIGCKAEGFFKRLGANITAYAHHLGETPSPQELIGSVKVMLDAYDEGKIDKLYIIYNQFITTIKQDPCCKQILPVIPAEEKDIDYYWDYIYEPDSADLLNLLFKRYIESQVYQGVIENLACEQAARMLAMQSASDNADEVISDLKLDYNKARQAAITRELAEIVSGAAAV